MVDKISKHAAEKYKTGTLIGTSDNRGWKNVHSERMRHGEGELGELVVRDTEVIVMIQGSLHIRRRGDGRLKHYDAVPGMLWLCPSGVYEDMIHLYGEVHESIHLYLPGPLLSRTALQEIDVDPDKLTLHYEGGFRDPLIEETARAIRAEMINPEPAGKMMVENLSLALGVHLMRHYSDLKSTSAPLPVARGALDPRRFRRVRDFIEAHLAEDLSIEMLANEACLSPFHFARAFKAASGTAPHAYLTERRIEKAKFLIAESRTPLAEIASLCGFSSQAYFTTWFKRITGATPGTYREGYL